MAGTDAGASSGAGHLLSFKGTDTIPAVLWLEKYYQANAEKELVGCSIPATEHAVAETNIIEIQDMLDKGEFPDPNNILGTAQFGEDVDTRLLAEVFYLDRLLNVYPSGLFSYVSDTYNLWEVCKSILPVLKDRIMSDKGHLCNEDSAIAACSIIGDNTKEIILAHISEECNTPEVALKAYKEMFEELGKDFSKYNIRVANQYVSLTGGNKNDD